jgi:hypothetical protein
MREPLYITGANITGPLACADSGAARTPTDSVEFAIHDCDRDRLEVRSYADR